MKSLCDETTYSDFYVFALAKKVRTGVLTKISKLVFVSLVIYAAMDTQTPLRAFYYCKCSEKLCEQDVS